LDAIGEVNVQDSVLPLECDKTRAVAKRDKKCQKKIEKTITG